MQEDQGRHAPGEEERHDAGVEAARLSNILGPVIDARGWGWCCGSSRPCLSHVISRRPHTCTADVTYPQLLTEDDLGLRLAAARCCCRCWRCCCAAETQIQDLAQALSTGDADLWRSVTRDRRMGCTSRLPGLLVQRGIHRPRRGCLSVCHLIRGSQIVLPRVASLPHIHTCLGCSSLVAYPAVETMGL